MAATFVQLAVAAIVAAVGTGIQAVFDSRMSHTLTVGDETKVFYEMAVCVKAACDLASTPGIVVPTESVPPVTEEAMVTHYRDTRGHRPHSDVRGRCPTMKD